MKSNVHWLLTQLVIICLFFGGSVITASADIITFAENTFDDANWNTLVVVGPSGGQTAVQASDGGNSGTVPDPFRSVTTNTSQGVVTAHADSSNTYDPSTAAITSLDFSIDFRNISFFGAGQNVGPMLEQAGVHYVGPGTITGPGGTNWTNYSLTGLTSDNFGPADSSAGNPDFSVNGSPITFGFATRNSGGNTIEVGYDNWSTIVATVPEPSAFLYGGLISTLVGCGVWVKRRFRHV